MKLEWRNPGFLAFGTKPQIVAGEEFHDCHGNCVPFEFFICAEVDAAEWTLYRWSPDAYIGGTNENGQYLSVGRNLSSLESAKEAAEILAKDYPLTGVDMVNHPPHYTDGKYEVIDFIMFYCPDYLRGQIVKYVSRAGKKTKNPVEDIQKALWYAKYWKNNNCVLHRRDCISEPLLQGKPDFCEEPKLPLEAYYADKKLDRLACCALTAAAMNLPEECVEHLEQFLNFLKKYRKDGGAPGDQGGLLPAC